jgi:hypothetical protein
MGINPLEIISGGLTAAGGIASAAMARNAFKHRYQDTVKDMKAAGLNPALAYGQGGGNPQTPTLPDVGESVTRAAGTAASAKQAGLQADYIKAQTDLLRAQTSDLARKPFLENQQLMALTGQTNARSTQIAAETGLTTLQSVGQSTENKLLELQAILRQNEATYANATLEDRIKLMATAVRQAGLNMTTTELSNALARANLPKAQILGDAATGAKQVIQNIKDYNPLDPIQSDIDKIRDWWTRTVHNYNQRTKK